jgi:extradiol dioxygenase family protein
LLLPPGLVVKCAFIKSGFSKSTPLVNAMSDRPPFHLAFPVSDLAAARRFYGELLGCREGRSADDWVDFDFYGHQIVAHRTNESVAVASNVVDGDKVPVRHFGVVLDMVQWQSIARRLTDAGADFIIEPHVRFAGQPGEQATLFIRDPSGNALEFKAFNNPERLFAK